MGGVKMLEPMERREFLKAGSLVATTAAVAGASACFGAKEAWGQEEREEKSHKWSFLIDLRLCSGCLACTVACKVQNRVPLGKFRTGVLEYEHGTYPAAKRARVPWLCNHCEKPVCIEDCPADKVKKPWGAEVAATYKRPDGVVVIDQDRCVGCRNCVRDCPYGVRFTDHDVPAGGDPELNAASKCDLCLSRISNGVVPSCVNTCPAGARAIVDRATPDDPGNKKIAENQKWIATLMPDKGTDPQCFYIDPEGILAEAYDRSPDRSVHQMNKRFK